MKRKVATGSTLIQRTTLREGYWRQLLVLHADNGAAMKSQTLTEYHAIAQSATGE